MLTILKDYRGLVFMAVGLLLGNAMQGVPMHFKTAKYELQVGHKTQQVKAQGNLVSVLSKQLQECKTNER